MQAIKIVGQVEFPSASNIAINMMPFIMGDKNSIPPEYQHYWPLVEKCETSEQGLIGYLSITESTTKRNTSQRRGGIHTEATLAGAWGGGAWGGRGGLFMASTVDNSCAVWDQEVEPVNSHGSIEDPSTLKGNQHLMQAGELLWLSDKVPHQSLPLPTATTRQWFRLVTNDIHGWYAQHSTQNRLGVNPDCPIIISNKFN